jgi:2-dehydropantoate 2-reductase
MLGEFQRPPEARTPVLAGRFCEAGVPCTVTDNLARAHWEKLVWNIPFNGLGVAGAAGPSALNAQPSTPPMCLTTDILLADPCWARLVRELMLEVIAAARALGHDVPDAFAEERIARTRTMGAYKASTLIDFERGQPLELESLFRKPLRQAAEAGVATPRLADLCAVLEVLEQTHRAAG